MFANATGNYKNKCPKLIKILTETSPSPKKPYCLCSDQYQNLQGKIKSTIYNLSEILF